MRVITRENADHGFTVAELVVSIGILLIVITAAMSAVSYSVLSGKMTERRGRAVNLANQRLEQARNLPYDNVGVTFEDGSQGEPPGSIQTPESIDEFVVSTQVSWARNPSTHRATYKRIKVTVSWSTPTSGSVSVASNVFGSSASVNTGDVEVRILDADTNDPIEGAHLWVTPASGSTRFAHTGDDGTAFFGYLPSGAVGVIADATGYLIDASSLAGATVANDSLTRLTLFAQRPSSATVLVVDPAGNPIPGATVVATRQGGSPQTATTSAAGGAVFSNLLKGNYTVAVSASGFASGTGVFVVNTGGESVQQTIVLARISTLNVHVTDSSGVALSGATVAVTGPSPSASPLSGSPGTTASSGDVGFSVATTGTYTITVSKTGYATGAQSVVVNGATSVTIALATEVATSGSLEITTVNSRGEPLPTRRVTVTNASQGYNVTVWTNDEGVVTLTDLVPGTYTITTNRDNKTASVLAGVLTPVSVRAR